MDRATYALAKSSAHKDTVEYVEGKITGVYRYYGTKTVAEINALDIAGLKNGYVYNISDSGKLIVGNIDVVEGDNVAWDGTKWDNSTGIYASMQYLQNNYLAKSNFSEYTPSGDYNPATKKYVDDSIVIDSIELANMLEEVYGNE